MYGRLVNALTGQCLDFKISTNASTATKSQTNFQAMVHNCSSNRSQRLNNLPASVPRGCSSCCWGASAWSQDVELFLYFGLLQLGQWLLIRKISRRPSSRIELNCINWGINLPLDWTALNLDNDYRLWLDWTMTIMTMTVCFYPCTSSAAGKYTSMISSTVQAPPAQLLCLDGSGRGGSILVVTPCSGGSLRASCIGVSFITPLHFMQSIAMHAMDSMGSLLIC